MRVASEIVGGRLEALPWIGQKGTKAKIATKTSSRESGEVREMPPIKVPSRECASMAGHNTLLELPRP